MRWIGHGRNSAHNPTPLSKVKLFWCIIGRCTRPRRPQDLMNIISDEFAGNLAFVGVAIAMWAHLSIWFSRQLGGFTRPAFGVAAGATAIGSIMLAAEVSPGVLIDIRHAPLALAGMFGGPIACLIAGAM